MTDSVDLFISDGVKTASVRAWFEGGNVGTIVEDIDGGKTVAICKILVEVFST
jgi:hypothetical protein